MEEEEVINFWFGDCFTLRDLNSFNSYSVSRWSSTWFNGSEEMDAEIKRRFLRGLDSVSEEEISGGQASLAKVLLLDQFRRNVYRNSPKAFSLDDTAQRITLKSLELKWDLELTPLARAFLYLPLLHSELLEHQRKSVLLFQLLLQSHSRKKCKSCIRYTQEFYNDNTKNNNNVSEEAKEKEEERISKRKNEIFTTAGCVFVKFTITADEKLKQIRQYGRFPLRNCILGRRSTSEEIENMNLFFV